MEAMVVKVVLALMSLVWVVVVAELLTPQSRRSYYPPAPLPTQKATACDSAHLCLDLPELVSGRSDFSTSKVYKTPKAFRIKIGVKPFGSSKLERINEPPSCSYRQLM